MKSNAHIISFGNNFTRQVLTWNCNNFRHWATHVEKWNWISMTEELPFLHQVTSADTLYDLVSPGLLTPPQQQQYQHSVGWDKLSVLAMSHSARNFVVHVLNDHSKSLHSWQCCSEHIPHSVSDYQIISISSKIDGCEGQINNNNLVCDWEAESHCAARYMPWKCTLIPL